MSFQNKSEYILFSFFIKIFNFFGIKRARYSARFISILFYYIIPVRKQVVLSNLRLAYPGLPEREIKHLAYKCYYSFAITLVEIMCIPFLTGEEILSRCSCPDADLIKQKHAENKGVIILTAHYGNWELGAIAVPLIIDIPMSVVVKPQRNGFVSDWLNQMREKFGNKTVPLGMSFRNIFRELASKHMIGLVGDQRGEPDGPRVMFMGINSTIYPGTAVLALRTGAPIMVAICQRQQDFRYITFVEEICTTDLSGSDDEKIIEINQRYSDILERYVRQSPEQWFWMHKRWKY